MKEDDVRILVQYRLQQAESSLDDAKYLLDGQRHPRSIVNRSYYAMLYAALALLQPSRVGSKRSVAHHNGCRIHGGLFEPTLHS